MHTVHAIHTLCTIHVIASHVTVPGVAEPQKHTFVFNKLRSRIFPASFGLRRALEQGGGGRPGCGTTNSVGSGFGSGPGEGPLKRDH